MRGRRVDATAPPWLRRDAQRRQAAEAICKASSIGWMKPHLAFHIEAALNVPPGEDYVLETGRVEARSGPLRGAAETWEANCRNARDLRDLSVDGKPVFITMGQQSGDAGYGYTGLLSITLRIDPRIRKRFAEGL